MELSNGCICCTMRGDLLREVTRLARGGAFDYLLIESTGVSEPMQVPLVPLVPSHALPLCHQSSAPRHHATRLETPLSFIQSPCQAYRTF